MNIVKGYRFQVKIRLTGAEWSRGETKGECSEVLSVESYDCFLLPARVCDRAQEGLPTREAHLSLVFRVLLEVSHVGMECV